MAKGHGRILLVDDDPHLLQLIAMRLQAAGYAVTAVESGEAALAALAVARPQVVVTDLRMQGMDGMGLFEAVHRDSPSLPVVILTAHGTIPEAVAATRRGVYSFLTKPFEPKVLLDTVAQAMRVSSPPGTPGQMEEWRSEIITCSSGMEDLLAQARRVAASHASVCIFGQSGTGKELLARAIHRASPRTEAPFVAVNCGAIPEGLLESELFGHKKGSFTGAIADKQGLIQSTEGGTLFLDEIADLPLHMQVKLLRVIQGKSVRPVGESKETPIDVRILSATHKNLAALVADGKFREDLFYRVNVIEIRVPPLRERLEDIDELVQSIASRLGRQMGNRALKVTDPAVTLLRDYHFPGNVRELENVLERAATLCAGGVIDASDLQLRPKVSNTEVPIPNSVAAGEKLGDALEDIERDAIVRALEQTRYNKTKAAQLLGMTFRSLRYRIKKLGIE